MLVDRVRTMGATLDFVEVPSARPAHVILYARNDRVRAKVFVRMGGRY